MFKIQSRLDFYHNVPVVVVAVAGLALVVVAALAVVVVVVVAELVVVAAVVALAAAVVVVVASSFAGQLGDFEHLKTILFVMALNNPPIVVFAGV